MLLTIFSEAPPEHELGKINQKLDAIGFWQKFSPEGAGVVSW
jgi:hypothetical protein